MITCVYVFNSIVLSASTPFGAAKTHLPLWLTNMLPQYDDSVYHYWHFYKFVYATHTHTHMTVQHLIATNNTLLFCQQLWCKHFCSIFIFTVKHTHIYLHIRCFYIISSYFLALLCNNNILFRAWTFALAANLFEQHFLLFHCLLCSLYIYICECVYVVFVLVLWRYVNAPLLWAIKSSCCSCTYAK